MGGVKGVLAHVLDLEVGGVGPAQGVQETKKLYKRGIIVLPGNSYVVGSLRQWLNGSDITNCSDFAKILQPVLWCVL